MTSPLQVLTVKSVLSGDTLVLRGRPVSGPPPEKMVSLALITAPRLNLKEPEKEEPFAFEAREFLRGLLIGKTVAFKTEYTTTSNQREFGSLLLQVPMDGETDVTRILVKQGWAKVKSSEGRHEASEAQQALLDLEKEAQESKKGIWADDGNGSHGPRSFSVNLQPADSEPKDFLAKYKGQPLPAVLELVRDATTFRACITLPTVPQSYQYVTLLLAGVKGPVLRKGIPNVPDQVEPFAEEGKFFVESRLLQKDVQVVLEGLSGNVSSSSSNQAYPSFIGSIRFPLGNISLLLLSEGFAKVNDWTLSMVTLDGDKYRDSEKRAKDKRLRQWKEYVPSAPSAPMESTFEAVVTKIVGPDLLLVEPIRSNKSLNVERKIQLSSIRGPKRQKNETGLEIGYYSEAVEFLRSRLVGKKVQVTMDYIKPAEGEYESRDCATLLNGAQNMAEALVSKGLAQVIRHKKDDENRSQKYDALLIAEDRAQQAQKGIWSQKELPVIRITDASESLSKAKQFLPFLQKSSTLSGVVEYASSGSRYRIYLPAQSCRITLVLGGIRVPRSGGGSNSSAKPEPYGPEALAFVNRHFLQRDAIVSIENTDKTGGFIGTLFVESSTGSKQMAAVSLLEQGLGYVHDYSAAQSPDSAQLYEAEARAKAANIGVWKDYDPVAEAEAKAREELASSTESLPVEEETKSVMVSEISRNGAIYLQVMGDEAKKLEKMMAAFSLSHKQAPLGDFKPKAGELCSAQFTLDNEWYRAQVLSATKSGSFEVLYIDYGNSEEVPPSRVRKLESQFSTASLRPQAQECKLAFVELPSLADEYGVEALQALKASTEGKVLSAKFISRGKVPQVVLATEKGVNLNEALLRKGYGFIDRLTQKKFQQSHQAKLKAGLARSLVGSQSGPKDPLEVMMEAQDEAKKAHLNIWRYGDFRADDEF